MGLGIFDETTPYQAFFDIQAADGTAYKAFTASQLGRIRVDAIYCSNDDSIAHYLQIAVFDGSAWSPYGTVTVPAGAGRTNVPAVEAIGLLIPAAIGAIIIAPFYQLGGRTDVAVTGGFDLYGTVQGGAV